MTTAPSSNLASRVATLTAVYSMRRGLRKPGKLGQAHRERGLAALEAGALGAAGVGALAVQAATGVGAALTGVTAADALTAVGGTLSGGG